MRSQKKLLEILLDICRFSGQTFGIAEELPAEQLIEFLYPGLTIIYYPDIMSPTLEDLLQRVALEHGAIIMCAMKCQNSYFHFLPVIFLMNTFNFHTLYLHPISPHRRAAYMKPF